MVDIGFPDLLLYLNYFALAGLIIVTSYTDLKYQKIYNKHTIPSFIFGITISAISNFPNTLINVLLASLIAFLVFFIMFTMGVMGGGDVKLVTAIGALIGYPIIVDALFWSIICGGVYATVNLIWHRELFQVLKQVIVFLLTLFTWKIKMPPNAGNSRKIPYGICISSGTVISLIFRHFNLNSLY